MPPDPPREQALRALQLLLNSMQLLLSKVVKTLSYSLKCFKNMLRKSILIGLFVVNPLTPVPAVTGHAKMHPQLPVLAVTGREKCEDNCLSYMYPPWRDFGPPIVLLLLGQISQWEWTFWVYFWGTLGVLERGLFCLKITRLKSGPNLQTSRVLLSFLKRTNYFFALKMERENIKKMFWWPQNGRSMWTKPSNLSGE